MPHALPDHTTGTLTSHDGTALGYRRLGSGPAVVLTHGSLMSSHDLLLLGAALSGEYTVYLPDLRGRGLSGAYGPDHTLENAARDVAAVMEHTGAHRIFGLSGGAVPLLRWALDAPAGYRIALYEPPLPLRDFSPTAWLPRYERELRRGRAASAVVTVMRGTQDPPWTRRVPRAVLVPLMGLGLRAQARRAEGGLTLRDLLPTMGPDARVVREATDLTRAATRVRSDVLLLGGSRSPGYLRRGLDALDAALPYARRVEFERLGHLAADNGGRPDLVARALADFFGPRVSRSARS
ncbi:alpha/beta fold hydrolase [Nocardiopsis sp. NPDC058789]|uniref:alpha/beta fold hydrolase n=1 Tax=Nocardiopsis TaxID=2013 RepID=UPI00366B90D5